MGKKAGERRKGKGGRMGKKKGGQGKRGAESRRQQLAKGNYLLGLNTS